MSFSNNRFQEPDSVHHLVSRIAHRVYFLKDEERNDFVGMMRRVAEFCGIKLLGWCIMTNHFHILAYLPFSEEISDEEIIRRYHVLKGEHATAPTTREDLDALRGRMYDLGEFMKILKQWFTQEYNRRYSHVGTLWESVYHDRPVKMMTRDMAQVLGYIHLNPIRAAACAGFDEYPWSSLHDAVRGDKLALEGLKFVYGEEGDDAERLAVHHALMSELLEGVKRKRAEEIARKRAAGYEVPTDALTDEAYVAQAAAHLEKVIAAGVEIHEERAAYKKCAEKREEIEHRIVAAIRNNPCMSADALSKALEVPVPTVYKYLTGLQKRGVLTREKRNSPWQISELYI